MTRAYKVKREDDGRTIVIVHRGWDAHSIMKEAVAAEFHCTEDELCLDEEFDADGEWTGDELYSLDGRVVARLMVP